MLVLYDVWCNWDNLGDLGSLLKEEYNKVAARGVEEGYEVEVAMA